MNLDEFGLPVAEVHADVVVFGSGAAGLRCAERLAALGVPRVALVTDHLGGGASNLSGSDKQTYYKMGVAGDAPDSPMAFAQTLTAGGLCHGDHAYAEGALSTAAFFHLCEIGVPFPHDAAGAYIGYKTDHDPLQRGTSAGPRTSHFMVQRLLARVRAAGVAVHAGRRLVDLLKDDGGRVCGGVTVEASAGADAPALCVYYADAVVLATGGPGALLAPSVYPAAQTGAHGVALAAGAEANNLGEMQFGLASTRYRWNLSGTYQQVVPRYFSRGTDDPEGTERDFLRPWFSSAEAMANAIFRKGYQWPFHVDYTAPDGSSRVDLAVAAETAAGRTVYLDFTRNPLGDDGAPIPLSRLDDETRAYLRRSGADQPTPLERLRHMNPDAIALYTGQGIDLAKPLVCAVCFQHHNGGLKVDAWWRTTVPGLYAIGETAGTHGVRPGGSALNAGQVGAMRAAEHIAHGLRGRIAPTPAHPEAAIPEVAPAGTMLSTPEEPLPITAAVRDAAMRAVRALTEHWRQCRAAVDSAADADAPAAWRARFAARMMDAAGFIRRPATLAAAMAATDADAQTLRDGRVPARTARDWIAVLENGHLALTGRALLATVAALHTRATGSRGGALVLADDAGAARPTPAGAWLYAPENKAARDDILTVRLDAETDAFTVAVEAPRALPDADAWYETVWADYRAGRIFPV